MAEFNQVYARAAYYDIAFRRDISREVAFIADEYQRLNGRPLESLLEIACGPGYHVREFSKRGVRAVGLDLRPEMIEFAKAEAAREGVTAEWIAADMRGFSLDKPADAIVTMYDSIDCLATGDDLVEHFRTVAANLTEGGMYLFEVTHPRDCSMFSYGRHSYRGERNGTKVEIIWAVNDPVPDPITQVARVETILRVTEHGKIEEFRDAATERFTLPQEFIALIKLAGGLRVVECYGDFVAGLRMDNSPASRRMIFVLQKAPVS
jgi:SAM-dependent methyltransferase